MKRMGNETRERLRRLFGPTIEALLRAANGEWRGIILIGLRTGMPLDVIARLRWNSIDRRRNLIRLGCGTRPVAGHVRVSPLLRRVLTSLPASHISGAPLFPNAATQTFGALHSEFKRLAIEAGAKRWSFDAVRLCVSLNLPKNKPGLAESLDSMRSDTVGADCAGSEYRATSDSTQFAETGKTLVQRHSELRKRKAASIPSGAA